MSRPAPLRSRAQERRASKQWERPFVQESDRQGQVLAAPPSALGCPSGKPKTHREQSGLVTVCTHGGASRRKPHRAADTPNTAAHTGATIKRNARVTNNRRPSITRPTNRRKRNAKAKKKEMQISQRRPVHPPLQPPAGCHRQRPHSHRQDHVALAGKTGCAGAIGRPGEKWTSTSKKPSTTSGGR